MLTAAKSVGTASLAEEPAFAKARAEALGPGLDWSKPKTLRPGEHSDLLGDGISDTLLPGPTALLPTISATNNYWALMDRARNLLSEKDWAEAKGPLSFVINAYFLAMATKIVINNFLGIF